MEGQRGIGEGGKMNSKQKSLVIDFMYVFFSLIFLWLGVDKSTIILSMLLVTYVEVIHIKWRIKDE